MSGDVKVIICARDHEERTRMGRAVRAAGFDVSLAGDLDAIAVALRAGRKCIVLLAHEPEAGMDAIGFFERMDREGLQAGIVVLASKPRIEDAVSSMRRGAVDYVLPPWTDEVVVHAASHAVLVLARRNARPLGRPIKDRMGADRHQILTNSPAMEKVMARARQVARSAAPVLIEGESGTGKELLARFIHRESDRSNGTFCAINCAALPETLLESELFGHEKGAFSGAIARKIGRFERADGGTLLLDEITEMALPLQAKLLRVLQEGEVDRLGGSGPIPVDVRVIATTNRDMAAAVREGRFREDLYYRLNVIPLRLPPLRERREDIPFLAQRFLEHFADVYGKPGLKFANDVLDRLSRRDWPGNVRELKNMMERGVLLAQGPVIGMEDLLAGEPERAAGTDPCDGQDAPGGEFDLAALEKDTIRRALARTNGNRTHAARLLGISVRTLRNKLSEYRQMDRHEKVFEYDSDQKA